MTTTQQKQQQLKDLRLAGDVRIKVGAFKGDVARILRVDDDGTALVLIRRIDRTLEGYYPEELEPATCPACAGIDPDCASCEVAGRTPSQHP